ncbi:MAG: hypothetical protein KAS15_05060, partial [Nanoarchaeota archaeon]|nr:hypothetical protein [Nanoarchaeota archaeon]
MFKKLKAKVSIEEFVKEYFPDSKNHNWDDSKVRKGFKQKLNKHVKSNDYDTLDFILKEGAELVRLDSSIGHNFIHCSEDLLSVDRDSLKYVVKRTKQYLTDGNRVEVKDLLEIYSNSLDQNDFELTMSEATELSNKLNMSLMQQSTNFSPTFARLYQDNKKRLGNKNFDSFISIVNNLSDVDSETAKDLFGYNPFSSSYPILNLDKLPPKIVSKFFDIIEYAEKNKDSGNHGSVIEARGNFIKTCSSSVKTIYNQIGEDFTFKVLDSVEQIANKSIESAESALTGLSYTMNKKDSSNNLNYNQIQDGLSILESVEQGPFNMKFSSKIYSMVKNNQKDELLDKVSNAESVAKIIDCNTGSVFETYCSLCEKYSLDVAQKVIETVKEQAKTSSKIAKRLLYNASGILYGSSGIMDYNLGLTTFIDYNQGITTFNNLAEGIRDCAKEHERVGLLMSYDGQFVARDFGSEGVKELANALCIIEKYSKGKDYFIAKMGARAAGKEGKY